MEEFGSRTLGPTGFLGKLTFQWVMGPQSSMADMQVQHGRCLCGSDDMAGKVQSTVGGASYCQRDSKGVVKVWQGGR